MAKSGSIGAAALLLVLAAPAMATHRHHHHYGAYNFYHGYDFARRNTFSYLRDAETEARKLR